MRTNIADVKSRAFRGFVKSFISFACGDLSEGGAATGSMTLTSFSVKVTIKSCVKTPTRPVSWCV